MPTPSDPPGPVNFAKLSRFCTKVPPAEDQPPLSAYGILTTRRKRFQGSQATCPSRYPPLCASVRVEPAFEPG